MSNSDERILRALASGEPYQIAIDWVALQHLKQRGLVEETSTGPKITDKGRQAMGTTHGHGH